MTLRAPTAIAVSLILLSMGSAFAEPWPTLDRRAVGPTGLPLRTQRATVWRPEDTPPSLPDEPVQESASPSDDRSAPIAADALNVDKAIAGDSAESGDEFDTPDPLDTPALDAFVGKAAFDAPAGEPSARRLRPPTDDRRSPDVPAGSDQRQAFVDLSWLSLGSNTLPTTAAAATLAIGLLLLTVGLLKRAMPRSARPLPGDVVSLLGRVPLAGKQSAQLMKVGGKLVLVAMTTDGAKPLTEITDPDEVARLIGLVEQADPRSASNAFQDVFDQLSKEPANGFLAADPPRFAESPTIDRGQLAAAYANTPGGRQHAA